MNSVQDRRRAFRGLALVGLALGLGACDSILAVQNPAAVEESELDNPVVAAEVANTVVGEFQKMYDDLVFAGAILGDEGVNGHNFTQWIDLDLRIMEESNSILASNIYAPLQAARAAGDNLSPRLRTALGATAGSDLRLARALAFAGYGNVMLGEYFCEAPVNPDEAALSSDEILRRAIARFDEAIEVATAAHTAHPAGADSILNLARVGAARAALGLNDKALAISYASQVPAGFEAWLRTRRTRATRRTGSTTRPPAAAGTWAWTPASGTSPTRECAITPPRSRATAPTPSSTCPGSAPRYSGWPPTAEGFFTRSTSIRFASGLEARYILAEAQGVNATNLAFVDSRRAVGGQAALPGTTTADDFLAALRDQRRRDFFLDGHRLGDLRRYDRYYGIDQFSSGPHPVASWGNYSTAMCFVPSLSERVGNPSY